MKPSLSDIKKEVEIKLNELKLERKHIIDEYRKEIEKAKIDQVRQSILGK